MLVQAEQLSADADRRYWRECARMRPLLIRIAGGRCTSTADPEDVVQEALVRGAEYRNLDLARLRQFLVAIVIRLCADEARRARIAGRMAGHPRLLPPATEDPAEFACDRAEARWIMRRLANLSPRDRRLVSMVVSGLPHKEIARRLRTTPQSTYSALYRIRRRITGCCV